MDRKLEVLGDEALTAVSGGMLKRGPFPPGLHPPGLVKKTAEAAAYGGSNSVDFGGIDIKGHNDVTIVVEQDASATSSASNS